MKTQNQRGGATPLIVVIIVIILAAAVYYYTKGSSTDTPADTGTETVIEEDDNATIEIDDIKVELDGATVEE